MNQDTDSARRPMVIRGGLVLDATGSLGAMDILVHDGMIVAHRRPRHAGPGRCRDHRCIASAAASRAGECAYAWPRQSGALDGRPVDAGIVAGGGAAHVALSEREEKRISATIGAAEMLLKGCTACYDLFVEFPLPTEEGIAAVADAYAQAGMRAVIAPMMADMTVYEAIPGLMEALPPHLRTAVAPLGLPPWQETIERMRSILHNWHGDRTMVRPAVAPTIPLHCRDEFMVACRDLAAEFDVGMHTHLAELKIQAVAGARRYGGSLTAHVECLGLLGPRFVAAHGVWLDGDDMRRLGAHGASIAHNPASNMRLGNGVADAVGMLAAGVNLAIGTDAATCNDNLNMYQALHFAAAASHARGPDPARWITAPQVFAAATIGSARALGFRADRPHRARLRRRYRVSRPRCTDADPAERTDHPDGDGRGRHQRRGCHGRRPLRGPRPTAADGRSAGAGGARGGVACRRSMRAAWQAGGASMCRADHGDFCPALARTEWHINRWCGCECGQE